LGLTDDPAGWHSVAKTYRNCPLTASAIEDYHIRPKVGEKKAGVDVGATRLERAFNCGRIV
jgi:hypothetical protein